MQARRAGVRRLLVFVLAATVALVSRTSHAQGQCATELQEQTSGPVADQGTVCGTAARNKCTFQLELCVNQPEAGCTPKDLKKRTIHASSLCAGGIGKVKVKANATSSVCGSFAGVKVKTKKHGTKAGSCKISAKAGKSKTKITLLCQPESAPCSTTTTTTTIQPLVCVTTTSLPTCGNGVVDGGEQCDPPCGAGCAAGQFCNSSCQCVATAACACGASTPTKLDFTTDVGTGECGAVTDGSGDNLLCLDCAGLYFGGGAVAVPLPATVPNMGSSLTKVSGCSDTCLTLANLTSTDTGSNRNCTSVDCLFGPPLPIPNNAAAPLSTCVINIVAADAQGFAQCDTGASSVNLPLTSLTYLFGDLLNGTTPDRPDVAGIQPCPVCLNACKVCSSTGASNGMPCTTNADCGTGGFCGGSACTSDADCPAGISCSSAPQCLGGPNDGLACTPGSGSLGDPYPTSHDCPPPGFPVGTLPGQPIGTLPIPFALTTSISSKPGVVSGTQQRVFCGYCRDANTGCFEGDPTAAMDGCPTPAGALHPCTSDADCTTPSYASCEQRDQGAFRQGSAATVFEVGAQAGSMIDGAAHPSRLVSVFCVPPTFNPAIDAAADLPGPGAVSLPGHAQLLP